MEASSAPCADGVVNPPPRLWDSSSSSCSTQEPWFPARILVELCLASAGQETIAADLGPSGSTAVTGDALTVATTDRHKRFVQERLSNRRTTLPAERGARLLSSEEERKLNHDNSEFLRVAEEQDQRLQALRDELQIIRDSRAAVTAVPEPATAALPRAGASHRGQGAVRPSGESPMVETTWYVVSWVAWLTNYSCTISTITVV